MNKSLKKLKCFQPFQITLTFTSSSDITAMLKLLRCDVDLGEEHNEFFGKLIEELLSLQL